MNKILQNIITEKEYREYSAPNYSKIKTFDISSLYYKNLIDGKIVEEDKSYFALGRAIHCVVLEPKRFNKEYLRCNINAPGGIIGNFTNELIAMCKYDNNIFGPNISKQEFEKAYSAIDTSWKLETIINKFNESSGILYFNFMCKNYNKTIISESDYKIILKCKDSVCNHKAASKFLSNENSAIELSIIWKYKDLILKSRLDKIVIDEEKKSVFIIELKTTSKPVSNFHRDYKSYKYYMQLAFYCEAAKCLFESNNYLDYTFVPIIIAVETKPFYETKIFEINDADIKEGNIEFTKILDRIAWHTKNNKWEYPKEYYDNSGMELLSFSPTKDMILQGLF